ncbi:MAG: UDP-3-O-[3-hydroxymyristoyl] N-acetylglucosamine deacetylase [Oligoflexia bacterium]|nr:UDP-3-O-[3-hydroxymyristoyl] N-acetylglucosamine deacetylase [Oligoflexia bacterium]
MIFQRTLRSELSFSGTALHSGQNVNICIKPAPANTGIVFIRTDIESRPGIKAEWSNVVESELSTVISDGKGARVATVEHLLSALRGLRVDNAYIEVSGPELPILDGSSRIYAEAIVDTGFVTQNKPRLFLQVVKPVSVTHQDRFVYLLPSSELKVTCRIDFKHPSIGLQHFSYTDDPSTYLSEVSRAKTFGFLEQAEKLKSAGLVLGGSYNNAIVLDGEAVVNPDMLSYPDEFVRHKLLDVLGDMSLTGSYSLLAHIVAYKSGHALHSASLKELGRRTSCFRVVEEPGTVDEGIFVREPFSLLDLVKSL